MSKIKQVICVRKDLHMRSGKIAAQAAHASLKVILNIMKKDNLTYPVGTGMQDGVRFSMLVDNGTPLSEWLNGHFTKVVVYVNSEEELRDVYNKAANKNLLCSYIIDSGFTEFHGKKTATCVAIGPDYSERIDEITGGLPLL